MKQRKNFRLVLAAIAFLLITTTWIATRPTLRVSDVAVIRLSRTGNSFRSVRSSYEVAKVGGVGSSLISCDKQQNIYVLGERNEREAVQVITANGSTRTVALNNLPGELAQFSKGFTVSPSGRRWWVWTRFTVKDGTTGENVRLYDASGKIVKTWQSQSGGIALMQAVGDEQLHRADETGSLWIYDARKATPQRLSFSPKAWDFMDSKGRFWTVNWDKDKRTGKAVAQSPANPALNISLPFQLPREGGGYPFWYDEKAGLYAQRVFWDTPSKTGSSGASVLLLDPDGQMKTVMDISPSWFKGKENQFVIFRRLLMAKGDTAWGEVVISKSGPVEHRIVKMESIPRWRTWFGAKQGKL